MMDIFGSGMQGVGDMMNGGLAGVGNAAGQGMDGVKQGLGGMGSVAQQGMGGLGSMFSSMLQAWMNLMQQFMGAGGSLASAMFGMVKSAFMNFFSIFGQLSGGAKGQVGQMYLQTGKTFNAVMKLKLNPQKHQKLIQQEMKAAQKVFETKFDHPQKVGRRFPPSRSAIDIRLQIGLQSCLRRVPETSHKTESRGQERSCTNALAIGPRQIRYRRFVGTLRLNAWQRSIDSFKWFLNLLQHHQKHHELDDRTFLNLFFFLSTQLSNKLVE
ncbi:hypothetical protein M3Y94_01003900 [Aphelenchoides besseyi]|nr:hypothetical protein M3Y94_01003900 [Aphelenchoides besseyi]